MRATLLGLAVTLCFAARAAAEERWYVLSIADTPVGYVSEDDGEGSHRTVVFARLARLGKSVELRFETSVRETPAGELAGLTYEAWLSQQPLRIEATVEGDRVRIVAPPQERFVERGAAPLLGPSAVARQTRERLRGASDAIEYATFSPDLQRVVAVRRTVQAVSDRVACNGTTAMKLEEVVDGLPAPRTLWVDGAGTMVADATASPFGTMSNCRATRDAALAARGELPADLYERTVARSNVRFADPFALDRVVLRVRPRTATDRLPDFADDNQTILAPGLVEVRRPRRERGDAGHAPGDLAANALVQSTDEEVVRVAQQVDEADPYATALDLTRWVAESMTLDAGVVMAPASELVRERRATCVGYATLLAALARAKGIPARVVMGYVYYGGIWGGHAWTELLIDGRWLPFDAAVYTPGVASAARLAVGRSDLADGGGELLPRLTMLFGRVDVEVVEYEASGRITRLTAGEPPYRVDGSTYENPGLGLRLRADGWTVERADSTWPSSLVVTFRRGETTVELHQRPLHPSRPVDRGAHDALFVSAEGGTLWVWSASGPRAADSLRELLDRVESGNPASAQPAAGAHAARPNG